MKKILFFLAIAMLVIAGCSKPDNPSDDPNDPNEATISFTLSSTIVSPSPLPANYVIDEHYIGVTVEIPGYNQNTGFSIPAPGGTRTFKGDTAKLWLGKNMSVGVYLKVYKPGHPYFGGWTTPSCPLTAKVAKTNIYNFTVGIVE